MRLLRWLALAILIPFAALGQQIGPPGVGSAISQIQANPGGALNAAGITELLGSPYNRPSVNDDYLHGEWPSMVYRSNGRSFVNVSNAGGNAVWQSLESLPLPMDTLGYYPLTVTPHTAALGSGFAQWDTITLQGGLTVAAASVAGGALTAPAGCAGWILGTTLTITTACTAGTLAPGETIAMAGVAAPAPGIPAGTFIQFVLTGSGGIGSTYQVNLSQTVGSSGSPVSFAASAIAENPTVLTFSGWISGSVLTVTTAPLRNIPVLVGATINSANSTTQTFAGTQIISRGTGTGGTGTYNLNVGAMTVGSSGSPVTFSMVSPIFPRMYGVCSPTTSAAAPKATSGSGTGATFDLSFAYPTGGGIRRLTECYTGNLVQVTNSWTGDTQNIAALSDYSMDSDAAFSFASSPTPMEQYPTNTFAPVPLVTIEYDQGPNGFNWTGSWTSRTNYSAPMLYRDRSFGPLPHSASILYNGVGSTGLEGPQNTFLTASSSLALNSSNASIMFAGGGLNDVAASSVISLTNTSSGSPFALQKGICQQSNAAGSGGDGSSFPWPSFTETPQVASCTWNAGVLAADHSIWPAFGTVMSLSPATINTTFTFSAGPGTNQGSCQLTSAVNLSYTSGATVNAVTDPVNYVNIINANATLQAAGITARPSVEYSFAWDMFQPQGSNCVFTNVSGTNVGGSARSGGGFAMQGGILGNNTTSGGFQYHAVDVVVPWAPTAQEAQRFRQSVDQSFDIDGHMGVLINAMSASNVNGYRTPFWTDYPMWLARNLKRNDVVVVNASGTGFSVVGIVAAWGPNQTFQAFSEPLNYLTTGKPTNNIILDNMEVNSLGSVGSNTAEYAAMQTVGAAGLAGNYTGAAGSAWSHVCVSSYVSAGMSATNISELSALIGDFATAPGNCTQFLNLQTYPQFANQTGPWTYPLFDSLSSTHPGWLGMDEISALAADAILKFEQ